MLCHISKDCSRFPQCTVEPEATGTLSSYDKSRGLSHGYLVHVDHGPVARQATIQSHKHTNNQAHNLSRNSKYCQPEVSIDADPPQKGGGGRLSLMVIGNHGGMGNPTACCHVVAMRTTL